MYKSLLAQSQVSAVSSSYGTLDSAPPSAPPTDMSSPKVASDTELAEVSQNADAGSENPSDEQAILERQIRLKVDFRLCTIAGILCSLNLLDSGVISSASVTSMLSDLGLDKGNRYSVSIFIFTIASICFQLPSTIAVRTFWTPALVFVDYLLLRLNYSVHWIHPDLEADDSVAHPSRRIHGRHLPWTQLPDQHLVSPALRQKLGPFSNKHAGTLEKSSSSDSLFFRVAKSSSLQRGALSTSD